MNNIRINHRQIPWNIKYSYAKEYYDKHGDLNVPIDYVCMDGTVWLYKWLINQRVRIKQGNASEEEIFLLNEIEINKKITTDGYLKRVKAYYEKYGNIDILRTYPIDDEGYNLGAWLSRQTFKYRNGRLNKIIKNELEKLGVCWDYKKDRYLVSFPEKCILYYLSKYYPDAAGSYTELGFELDIFIPSLKLGIEYDGQNWHKNIDRDLQKNIKCENAGIRLIRLREEKCPHMESTENTTVINVEIERKENNKLNTAINELICTIKKSYLIDWNIDVDRDWTKINKDYISRNEMKW